MNTEKILTMEPKYTVIQLHPVPVCRPEEEYIIYDKTLKFINELEFNPRDRGGGGNGARSANSYILECKELLGLKKFIEKHIDYYAHEFFKVSRKHQFYITQSWVNFNRKGQRHHAHHHANSLLSGVFYVAGDDCPINFSNSRYQIFGSSFDVKIAEGNLYNAKGFRVANENFRLILFPSYVEHFVEPNMHDTPRISLSMNTFIKGSMGTKDSLTEVIFK